MPLVTIAIPVYNAEQYLQDAIQSVVNQTFRDWVLFLINDGSTDGSLEIMQKFASAYPNIEIIDDGENKGLVARLNESIAMTTTKYYARMDADDIMYYLRLEEQVNYLEEHNDVDVVGSSAMLIDNNNNIKGSWLSQGKVSRFIHPTVIGRTDWFKDNKYKTWAIRAEDSELWIRTERMSKFYSIQKPLLFYREYGVPTLDKTIKSLRTMIVIYSHYKEYERSLFWGYINIIFCILKIVIYMFFDKIGQMNFIIHKRRRDSVLEHYLLNKMELMKSIRI